MPSTSSDYLAPPRPPFTAPPTMSLRLAVMGPDPAPAHQFLPTPPRITDETDKY